MARSTVVRLAHGNHPTDRSSATNNEVARWRPIADADVPSVFERRRPGSSRPGGGVFLADMVWISDRRRAYFNV
jgi:hypothetical protein